MKEYFEYLDNLRASGVTNMFGAGSYLAREFGLLKAEASEILSLWIRTFKDGVAVEERVASIEGEY